MKIKFLKLFLVCMFKDPNLAEKLTNLVEHLKKMMEFFFFKSALFPLMLLFACVETSHYHELLI